MNRKTILTFFLVFLFTFFARYLYDAKILPAFMTTPDGGLSILGVISLVVSFTLLALLIMRIPDPKKS